MGPELAAEAARRAREGVPSAARTGSNTQAYPRNGQAAAAQNGRARVQVPGSGMGGRAGLLPRQGGATQQRAGATLLMDAPRAVTTKPPLYTGTEWSLWSLRFEMWAKVGGLWPYFQGLIPRPEEVTPLTIGTPEQLLEMIQARESFDYTMDRAYEALLSCMEKPEHLRLIAEFKGRAGDPPRVDQAWQRLKSAHTLVQETSFLRVSKELADLRLGNNEPINQYWARAQDIRERCLEAEVPVPTRSFLSAVLSGLPNSWAPLVMMESRMLTTLTEDTLLMSLLEEEDRRGTRAGGNNDNSALYGVREASPGNNKGRRPWTGQTQGYNQRYNTQGGRGSGPRRKMLGRDGAWGDLGPAPQGHCDGCHIKGHQWRACFKRPTGAVPKHLKKFYNEGPNTSQA